MRNIDGDRDSEQTDKTHIVALTGVTGADAEENE